MNCGKWLRNHPWIFLFQNLFDHPASYDVVRIKQSVCHSTGVDLAAYQIGFKSAMSIERFRVRLSTWRLTFL